MRPRNDVTDPEVWLPTIKQKIEAKVENFNHLICFLNLGSKKCQILRKNYRVSQDLRSVSKYSAAETKIETDFKIFIRASWMFHPFH